jgi:hypothetical protein
MTEAVTRRGFFALIAALAATTLTPEAPQRLIVEVSHPEDRNKWTVVPGGLRDVRSGQRVRTRVPEGFPCAGTVLLQGIACEDGHDGVDADQHKCGAVMLENLECRDGAWL